MTQHYTTFTPLAVNEVLDRSDEYAAVYNLVNPNKLTMGEGSRLLLGPNSTIIHTGNVGHSFRNGVIVAKQLTYVAEAAAGERVDFHQWQTGGMETEDLTYVYLGAGYIFNHLEPANQIYTGFTRFILAMTGGTGYIQFEIREFQNVGVDISNNAGALVLYAARRQNGWTSLPNFSLTGGTSLNVFYGTANSRVKFYDPVSTYDIKGTVATTGDELVGTGGGRGGWEYLTLDLTAIRDDDVKVRVRSQTQETFNDFATVANTQIMASDGVTPLAYYANRNVIPIKVRTFSNVTTARVPVSYVIRKKGYLEIKADNTTLVDPVVISEIKADPDYDTSIDGATVTGISVDNPSRTITLTETRTTQEIYNFLSNYLANNLDVANEFSMDGLKLSLGTYSIAISSPTFVGDITANASIVISDTTDITGSTFSEFSDLYIPSGRDLTNVTVAGTLTFNDNNTASFAMANSTLNILRNSGTGLLTWNQTGSTVADQSDAGVSVVVAPTPSTMNLTAVGRWAIYNNSGTFVESGTGNKILVHAGGVDAGTWTVVVAAEGKVAQKFAWESADGSTNNFNYVGVVITKAEGGPSYSGGTHVGLTISILNDKVHSLLPNRGVQAQELVDLIHDFRVTDAGLDWIHDQEIFNAPYMKSYGGVIDYLNVVGYTHDSVAGATPLAALEAGFQAGGEPSAIVTTNGAFSVNPAITMTEQSISQAVWDANAASNNATGTMGALQNKSKLIPAAL